MQRRLREVLEDEDHIELLEGELDALQRRDLDLAEGDDEEGRVREMDETLRRGLQLDVRAERYALEREVPVGDVCFQWVFRL